VLETNDARSAVLRGPQRFRDTGDPGPVETFERRWAAIRRVSTSRWIGNIQGLLTPTEEKYRRKWLDLKAKSEELETGNDKLHVKLAKVQREIYRLKVEKG